MQTTASYPGLALFLQCYFTNLSIKQDKNQMQLITLYVACHFNGEAAGVHQFNDPTKDLRSKGRNETRAIYFLSSFTCLWHHYSRLSWGWGLCGDVFWARYECYQSVHKNLVGFNAAGTAQQLFISWYLMDLQSLWYGAIWQINIDLEQFNSS